MIGVKPSYFARVQALKAEIEADPAFKKNSSDVGRTYAQLRREAEAAATVLREVNLRLEACKLLMIDQFRDEGETGLTLSNGDKIRWQSEPHLVVLDKEVFRQWCIAQGLEYSMVLPWGTANKLVKDMLFTGKEEPPGTEAFLRPKVIFNKG